MTAESTPVLAPIAGTVVALADVPDPVFAEQLVGAGAAVEPADGAGPTAVCAPVAGTVVKAHPHAFIVRHGSGVAVLVHVGIDTVKLAGEGFDRHVEQGAVVAAGDPVVTFDPTAVRGRGLSAVTPVVVLDSPPDSVAGIRSGHEVRAGEPLYAWTG